MGKKQREERKASVQLEPRRPSVGTTTSALSDRPTSRVTIGQIVENHSQDIGFEQHLPGSSSYFENIRIDPEGSAVVSPLYSQFADGERFSRRDSSDTKGSFTTLPSHSNSEEADSRRKSKRWAYKNVYGLSLAFVVLFTAFIGLQNLQSSINSAGGLGLVTLSLLYAMFIAAGFITPAFLKLFGTKYSLLFGFICHLIYTLTNYYPSWYTLVPASILIGFASGPLWAAASTHLAEVAVMVAPSLGKKQDYLISKFTGVFFFFFQFSQVPGNLASSLILFPYTNGVVAIDSDVNLNTSSNDSFEESEEACDILTSQSFDVKYLYILVSVYVGFIVTSIVLLLVFVDRLPTNNNFFSAEKKLELYLKKPLIELLKVLKDVKMLLIAPMVVYNGMELAFAFGTFTEVNRMLCIVSLTFKYVVVCVHSMDFVYM
jgi:MFS family permease